ncbi:WD40 repeat-containing protein HOS15 [Vitis vinifera]|uniref:WD40 repeat-containing protein HOS15 n=1 Tax=Vitis vinifera TaxID=29760 RepID=A0A438ITZ1_VITVI|nr:WD40 repeat-containing protein HOS15 [Vitis vinifera]
MQNGLLNIVLKHFRGRTNEKNKDVTTLDWNGDGTVLATGSYDNQARIWSRVGMLRSTLNKHKGPVFSLKWNKKGIVWVVVGLETFCRHNILVVSPGIAGPNRRTPLRGQTNLHTEDEVNAVKWNPTVFFLASCSDDYTAKDDHLHDLKEHTKEIYTIRWSPTGAGTNNPNHQLVLSSLAGDEYHHAVRIKFLLGSVVELLDCVKNALWDGEIAENFIPKESTHKVFKLPDICSDASFDSTIKLWDVELGCLLYSLNGHRSQLQHDNKDLVI